MPHEILILPGDYIGLEVTAQAERVIAWLTEHAGCEFTVKHGLLGGAAYDETGSPIPDETIEAAKSADAVLLGAVGGPKWEGLNYEVRPERGLLGIRKALELFANLRPAIVFDELADASTLKREVVAGLDIMIVRELTGGIYFGEPKGVTTLADGTRRGVNTLVYTTPEIRRIAHVAFDLAEKRGGEVCSVDKANVLEATELWREEVQRVRDEEYPSIGLKHMYVDNAAMQLVRDPKQFDVIVTTNMFGDILSDCAAMLTGSLGMLPSASLGARREDGKRYALYEPVHGSAPDIAGKNLANPIATLLSLAMMFKYSFDKIAEAELVENAVKDVLAQGIRTADIAEEGVTPVGTTEIGDAILAAMETRYAKEGKAA